MAQRSGPDTGRIMQDPAIMVGKPVVRGTRIPVEHVLAHLAAIPDLDELFAAYPRLTMEDVQAVFAYAHAVVDERYRQEKRGAAHAPGPKPNEVPG